RDLLRLEGLEPAYAVVLVDDVVAGSEVGEALEGAPNRCRTARSLPEDLRVGKQDEAEVPPHEASPRRCDGEEELRFVGERLARLDQARVDTAQQVLRPQPLAGGREGHTPALPGAKKCAELVLGLGEPAGGEGRPLRLEGKWLVRRQRIKLGRARQVRLDVQLLERHFLDLVCLPDE